MAGYYITPTNVDNISRAIEFLYITFFRRPIVAALILSLFTLIVGAQSAWIEYKNSRFGYSVSLPAGLLVANRASDKSGVTWQTGTVRVQVSGVNNPYKIKPHEYFSGIKGAAGDRVVAENHGQDDKGYWYEILYTKDSRRVHRKVYISSGAINSIEYSYGYRYREDKEALAKETLASFRPGDLTKSH
jgi:hypothetical protein